MVRARKPTQFAFSPKPADDELLSSWLHRTAIGHAASGLEFLQFAGGDVDWRPPDDLLVRLASGSGLPLDRLRAMTLSGRWPNASRDWFAMSQTPFPGCHAFCPLCALVDIRAHGAVVQRAANAGVWTAICGQHGCLLDGVGGVEDVTPRWRRKAAWEDGAIAPSRVVTAAPDFLVEFQATAERALQGVHPDTRWLVREAEAFLSAAEQITDLTLLKSTHDRGSSGLGQLVGHVWPEASRMGANTSPPDWLGRLPTPDRARTLIGVALLLMNPVNWPAGSFEDWFGQSLASGGPWALVGRLWQAAQIGEALRLAAQWPQPLRREAEHGLGLCVAEMRAKGYQLQL